MKLNSCIIVAVVGLCACNEPTAVSTGALTVQHVNGALQLHNSSGAPVFYFVTDPGTAALINWAACVTPSCPSIPAHSTVTVSDPRVPANVEYPFDALVYWWQATPDGTRPDSVRNVTVSIR